MSSVQIITTIIILLAVLVCYAFIAQSIKIKQEKRKRLLISLKRRHNAFKFMLNGFPKGFLSKDLTLLVQNSLIETLDQLVRLESNEGSYAQDLQIVSKQMSEMQRESGPPKLVKMASAQQIKDVKLCLEELNKFIHLQERNHLIAKNKADVYHNQIKQCVLQISVDSYELRAKASLQLNKLKLAYHYYDLALKMLLREGRGEFIDAQVKEFKEILKKLAQELEKEESSQEATDKETGIHTEINEQWDNFSATDDSWKKKNVYD